MKARSNPTLRKKKHPKSISETRKIRKPLMEKRRRDRINSCLSTLAALLTEDSSGSFSPAADALEISPSVSNKKPHLLEKAEILEKTVEYWNTLDKVEISPPQDGSFIAGYQECIEIVDSLLREFEDRGDSVPFRSALKTHLEEEMSLLTTDTDRKNQESDQTELLSQTRDQMLTFLPRRLSSGDLILLVKDLSGSEVSTTDTVTPGQSRGDLGVSAVNNLEDVWRPW